MQTSPSRFAPPDEVRAAVAAYFDAGLSTVLLDAKGKRPLHDWRECQEKRRTLEELLGKLRRRADGVGIVCGAVSDGLEAIDFDQGGRAFDDWRQCVDKERPGLVERLVVQRTQSGGRHALYRCDEIGANQRLARDADGQVLIETRGEGGDVVAAPSPAYQVLRGDLAALPRITEEERETLLACARSLDESPPSPRPLPSTARLGDGDRPGDRYNAESSAADVLPLLERAGWKLDQRNGDRWQLTRPGKERGVSATLFADGTFYVFSSNSEPFESLRAYSPFAVYSLLKHGGDFTAAAQALHRPADAASGGWAASIAEPEPWRTIEPLSGRKLPPFPTAALPSPLREMVRETSLATQTPPGLAGLVGLATCAAAAAGYTQVEGRLGFVEPVNLFVAPILGPGNRKSAVFAEMTRPLVAVEAAEADMASPAVARDHEERERLEGRIKKRRRECVDKGNHDSCNEAIRLAQELAEREVLVLPRRTISDCTPELVDVQLAEQGGRIASMSSEGGVFDLMAGLYSKSGAANFDVYLKGHAGDAIIVDRISRSTVQVERPALTCAYTIQPAVIQGLARKPAFRGRGLLARFLYAVPRSWIGYRVTAPPPVREGVAASYAAIVTQLATNKRPALIQLGEAAREEFESWEREIEVMLRDGGELELLRDWGAKLTGATLRIAGVLHVVEQGNELTTISAATMQSAVAVARYLVPHAEAALALMSAAEEPIIDQASWILRWIERQERREFSKSEPQQHGRRQFPKADDVDGALALLRERGYIRALPGPSDRPGRPASPRYEVNPAFFSQPTHEFRTKNPECSKDGAAPESFQHLQYESDELENLAGPPTESLQNTQYAPSLGEIPESEWETAL